MSVCVCVYVCESSIMNTHGFKMWYMSTWWKEYKTQHDKNDKAM